MKSWSINRGYPKTLIAKEVSEVKFLNILGDKKTKTNGIPLVITNLPLLEDLLKL